MTVTQRMKRWKLNLKRITLGHLMSIWVMVCAIKRYKSSNPRLCLSMEAARCLGYSLEIVLSLIDLKKLTLMELKNTCMKKIYCVKTTFLDCQDTIEETKRMNRCQIQVIPGTLHPILQITQATPHQTRTEVPLKECTEQADVGS